MPLTSEGSSLSFRFSSGFASKFSTMCSMPSNKPIELTRLSLELCRPLMPSWDPVPMIGARRRQGGAQLIGER